MHQGLSHPGEYIVYKIIKISCFSTATDVNKSENLYLLSCVSVAGRAGVFQGNALVIFKMGWFILKVK